MSRQFDAVHLQMIRCAGKVNLDDLANTGESVFMLFDYYDALIVKEEKEHAYIRYENCIGQSENGNDINKQHQRIHVSAVNSATLVRFAQEPYPRDLFAGGARDQEAYSERPFLAVMILTLRQPFSQETDTKPDEIIPFLRNCIQELEKKAWDCLYEHKLADSCQLAGFVTMDMGHFALVIRSATPEPAYIVMRKLEKEEAFHECGIPALKGMRLEAFTTLGMEMSITWRRDGIVEKPPIQNMSQWEEKCLIVLRLGHGKLLKWLRGMLGEKDDGDLHSLYGRYQYTKRVSFVQFITLLPKLCCYKFGSSSDKQTPGFEDVPVFEHATDVINERLLLEGMDETDDLSETGEAERHDSGNLPYQEQNPGKPCHPALFLYEKLQRILRKEYVLPYGHGILYENLRLFREVTGTCSSILQFTDSHQNGTILYMLLFLALDSLEVYLNWFREDTNGGSQVFTIHDRHDREAVCADLLTSLSGCLEDIVSFLKTIQTVNFQTLQAPHYEIQPGIDGEKYVLAAQEFVRRFAIDWVKKRDRESTDTELKTGKYFFPFMCIDHHFGGPRASIRFLPPRQHISQGPPITPILLNIAVPNFQYFVRPYDLLPLALHEMSHNLRFMPRPERNQAFLSIVFSRIAQYITERWFWEDQKEDITSYWKEFRFMVQEVIANVMGEMFNRKRKKHDGTEPNWNEHVLSELKDAISAFMYRYVFWKEEAPADFLNQDNMERAETLKKLIQEFYHYSCLYVDKTKNDIDHYQTMCQDAWTYIKDGKQDLLNRFIEEKIQAAIINDFVIPELESMLPLFLRLIEGEPGDTPRASIGRDLLKLCRMNAALGMREPLMIIGNLLTDDEKIRYRDAFEQYKSALAFKLLLDEMEQQYSKCWNIIVSLQNNNALSTAVEQALREVRNSLKRLMDLRILSDRLRMLVKLWKGNVKKGEEYEPLEPHAEFIHLVAESLCNKAQNCLDSYFDPISKSILTDSGLLGRKFLLSSSKEYLETELAECLSNFSPYDSAALLKSAQLFYDETCTDLAMCAAMNLEPFGYLRLLIRHENRINESSWTPGSSNISFERLNAVVTTMLFVKGKGSNLVFSASEKQKEYEYVWAEELVTKEKRVINSVLKAIKERLENELGMKNRKVSAATEKKANKSILIDFMKHLEQEAAKVKEILDNLLEGKSPDNKISVPDEIILLIREYKKLYRQHLHKEAGDKDIPGTCFQEWRYMLISVVFFMEWGQQISIKKKDANGRIEVKRIFVLRLLREPLRFFAKLYETLMLQDYSHLQGNMLRKEIGDYYNLHRIVLEGKERRNTPDHMYRTILEGEERRNMLDHTFAFVLQYYFSSRFSLPDISNCCNENEFRQKILEYLGKDVKA